MYTLTLIRRLLIMRITNANLFQNLAHLCVYVIYRKKADERKIERERSATHRMRFLHTTGVIINENERTYQHSTIATQDFRLKQVIWPSRKPAEVQTIQT